MNRKQLALLFGANAVLFSGFGILLHDFAHQVWELKGYHNIMEGGYIGAIVLLIGWIMLSAVTLVSIEE